ALDAERELVLALVPIGNTPDVSTPPSPDVTPLNYEIEPYSKQELVFPPIGAMHAASALPDAEAVAAWRSAPPHLSSPAASGPLIALEPLAEDEARADPIEQVILRRGSTRVFAREAIGFRQLSTALDRALRGLRSDFSDLCSAPLNDVY